MGGPWDSVLGPWEIVVPARFPQLVGRQLGSLLEPSARVLSSIRDNDPSESGLTNGDEAQVLPSSTSSYLKLYLPRGGGALFDNAYPNPESILEYLQQSIQHLKPRIYRAIEASLYKAICKGRSV